MDQANTTSEAMTPAVSVGPGPVAAIPMSPASLIAKLTLADKVIAAAAAVGIISTFLPAVSVSLEILGTKQSNSAMVIGDWRGKLGLLCFLAAGTILFLLIQKGAAASKNLLYGLLGACGLAPLLGIFLLIGASSRRGKWLKGAWRLAPICFYCAASEWRLADFSRLKSRI
jgi:hypothetical protein